MPLWEYTDTINQTLHGLMNKDSNKPNTLEAAIAWLYRIAGNDLFDITGSINTITTLLQVSHHDLDTFLDDKHVGKAIEQLQQARQLVYKASAKLEQAAEKHGKELARILETRSSREST